MANRNEQYISIGGKRRNLEVEPAPMTETEKNIDEPTYFLDLVGQRTKNDMLEEGRDQEGFWSPEFLENVDYYMDEWVLPTLAFGGGFATGLKGGKRILGKHFPLHDKAMRNMKKKGFGRQPKPKRVFTDPQRSSLPKTTDPMKALGSNKWSRQRNLSAKDKELLQRLSKKEIKAMEPYRRLTKKELDKADKRFTKRNTIFKQAMEPQLREFKRVKDSRESQKFMRQLTKLLKESDENFITRLLE